MYRFLSVLIVLLSAYWANAQKFEWANHTKATAVSGRAVDVDRYGNVYVAGSVSGTAVDFDPGPGVMALTAGARVTYIEKMNPQGQVLWAKAINSVDTGANTVKYNECMDMKVDEQGNIYVVGTYGGGADFDPGPGVYTLANDTSSGRTGYILKLDANGNFVWANDYKYGTHSIEPQSIAFDQYGGLYIAGYLGFFTFNNGNGPVIDGNCFIAKLNSAGLVTWADEVYETTIGLYQTTVIRTLKLQIDQAGNFYISGQSVGTADFDPGIGIATLVADDMTPNVFIAKYDSAFNYLWAKAIGAYSREESALGMAVDADGSVYAIGTFSQSVDFNPDTGTFIITSTGIEKSLFILKLNAAGQFVWAKSNANIGGVVSGYNEADIAVDKDKFVYITSAFWDSTDLDPGPGTQIFHTTSNRPPMYIQKLDAQGNFVWAETATGKSSGYEMTVDSLFNIYITGEYVDSVDIDPGSGNFKLENLSSGFMNGRDYFILKLSQDSCSNFSLTFDSTHNVACGSPAYASVELSSGTPPYSYVWNTTPPANTAIANINNPGIYTVTAIDSNLCSRSASVLISGPASATQYDLNTQLIADPLRPGFTSALRLDAFNSACGNTNAQLTLTLDPAFTYVSSSIAPGSVNGNTLIWNINSLSYDSAHFTPVVNVVSGQNTPLGSNVCFDVAITPTVGDIDTSNNVKRYCFTIVGSYDPNDKQVYPAGACEEKYVATDRKLTYTVRFQNTGTASAINVFILDTLSTVLDMSSVKILAASHAPLRTEVISSRTLKFIFDNIQLPDSNSNEPLSHGYVVFEADAIAGTPDNTIIANSAAIYFDFNEPVITNSVSNTLVATVPDCMEVGISENNYEMELKVFPNPATNKILVQSQSNDPITDLQVLDYLGRIIYTQSSMNSNIVSHQIDCSAWSQGVYLIKTFSNGKQNRFTKMIKQ